MRGGISLDTVAHEIALDGEAVFIPRREFAILQKLLENQGRVISRETIVQVLYGWGEEVDSNVVEVHIHNLRKKFGNQLIRTIRGVGYMIAKISAASVEPALVEEAETQKSKAEKVETHKNKNAPAAK